MAFNRGSLTYCMNVNGGNKTVIISNVLYAPKLTTTLLSIASFTAHRKSRVIFNGHYCHIISADNETQVIDAKKGSGGLYCVLGQPIPHTQSHLVKRT
jgi:hypothetical protein